MTTIGSSDLEVYPLNLGGNTFGWTSDKETSFAVLDGFAAGGGNFIDTADGYSAWVPGNAGGESETIIGEWTTARGNRDSVVIATKVSQHPDFKGLSASNVAAAADASLARLGTDHIDLYYAHFDDEATPLVETLAAFDALVTAGKVRYVGISNYSAARIGEWIDIAKANGFALPVALQPHYNLVNREPFETELRPLAEANDLGVMPYWSLASGFLTGKYRSTDDLGASPRGEGAGKYLTPAGLATIDALEEIGKEHGVSIATTALAWLLAKPTIVAPIASARTPEQLGDLLAVANVTLTAEQVARLDEVSAAVSA
jgi:aryl-alcohol dehydrogenase-like predicted oxidoreductase